MVNYTIINSTAAELTDVNAGGTDIPAHTIQTGVALSSAELATVTALNGVAVMQDAPTAAEKKAVADEILAGGAGSAPATSVKIGNGSASTVEAAAAYSSAEDSLTASEIIAALGTAGVLLASGASSDEQNRKAAKALTHGSLAN